MNKHAYMINVLLKSLFSLVIVYLLASCAQNGTTNDILNGRDTLEINVSGPLLDNGNVRYVMLELSSDADGVVTGKMFFSSDIDTNPLSLDDSVTVNGTMSGTQISLDIADTFVLNLTKVGNGAHEYKGNGMNLYGQSDCKIGLKGNPKQGQDLYNAWRNNVANKIELNEINVAVSDSIVPVENTKKKLADKRKDVLSFKKQFNYPLGSQKLEASQLQGLNKDDLRRMRNEIYARNGYIFASNDMRKYFKSQKWYLPFTTNDEEVKSMFNTIEQYNVDFIVEQEKTLE